MKKRKKKTALFTFCIISIFITNQLFAQKDIKNSNISYVKNEYNEISKIEFKGGKAGEKSFFDVYENNPYNKLNYPLDKQKTLGNNVYKFDYIPMAKVIKAFKSEYYKNEKIGKTNINGFVSNSLVRFSEDKKYQIIVYQLGAKVDDDIIGAISTIIIVDSTGSVFKKFENIEMNINKIGITIDGKYLFFSYGFDNENGTVLKHGVRIFDILKNRVITEKMHSNYGGFITSNLIVIGYDYYEKKELLSYTEVYDLYNSKKYTRTFKYDEQSIIEITKEGYLINYNNQHKLLSFKNDFLIENL